MKDLDFDELDRAVNSLMSNAGSDTPNEPKEKVVTIPTTIATRAMPQASGSSVPSAATTQSDAVTPANSTRSSASPAARRGGRFMDVVRPASNTASTAPNRVSREGVTIAAPTAPTAPTATLPKPVTSQEPAITPEVSQAEPAVSSWPDPLDFHKDTTAAADPTPAATSPVQPAETPSVESSDAQDPLQSPFLADAKVDKRPLGAFAASPNVAVDAFAAPPTTATDETAQPEQQPVAPPTPAVVPDELKSDIVAIESDDGAVEIEKTEVTATVQPSAQSAATTVSLGATSIKQQYQEEPSTTPVEHAPIYDSEPYHQPLAHPAKKKSGWLVVLLIFLLLILGAGAGAAIYFYVL